MFSTQRFLKFATKKKLYNLGAAGGAREKKGSSRRARGQTEIILSGRKFSQHKRKHVRIPEKMKIYPRNLCMFGPKRCQFQHLNTRVPTSQYKNICIATIYHQCKKSISHKCNNSINNYCVLVSPNVSVLKTHQ